MHQAFIITYIRPISKYNSIVCNTSLMYLIDLTDVIQESFTKRLLSISYSTYPDRLAVLDLGPLKLRRLRTEFVNYFKDFNNLIPFIYEWSLPYIHSCCSTQQMPPENIICLILPLCRCLIEMPYLLQITFILFCLPPSEVTETLTSSICFWVCLMSYAVRL